MEKHVQSEQQSMVFENQPKEYSLSSPSKDHPDLFGDAKLNRKTVFKRIKDWIKKNICCEKEIYYGTLFLNFNSEKLAQGEQRSEYVAIGGSKWCIGVDSYSKTLGLHFHCQRKSAKICSDANFTIIVYNSNTVTELGVRGTGFFGGQQLTSEWKCENFVAMDFFENPNNGIVDKHGNATVMVKVCVVSSRVKYSERTAW